jgi:hypothetical protein
MFTRKMSIIFTQNKILKIQAMKNKEFYNKNIKTNKNNILEQYKEPQIPKPNYIIRRNFYSNGGPTPDPEDDWKKLFLSIFVIPAVCLNFWSRLRR